MARPLTARMARALRNGAPICLLGEIGHPDGIKRFWTGVGPLEYDGVTWIGLATLGSVAPVKYTAELVIQEIVFTLSGMPEDAVTWLPENVRNLPAGVWLAALENGAIVADPYQIISALQDYPSFKIEDDGTASISLFARAGFYTLERAVDEVHSSEDQKRIYGSTDTGLDMIPGLQRTDVIWRPDI